MTKKLKINGSIQAEYEDGFILDETDCNDISPHDSKHNIFRDILKKWSEPEHGKMVRFTMFYNNKQYNINWVGLPDNARPVRYKNIEQDSIGARIIETRLMKVGFGYQYTDKNGKNIEEIEEF
jgi:hypothetical protein